MKRHYAIIITEIITEIYSHYYRTKMMPISIVKKNLPVQETLVVCSLSRSEFFALPLAESCGCQATDLIVDS